METMHWVTAFYGEILFYQLEEENRPLLSISRAKKKQDFYTDPHLCPIVNQIFLVL
jgi:hypothetical protein